MTVTKTTRFRAEEVLTDPQIYPDKPAKVEVRETHISRVFLTERFAYKLKKPVRFDFLDFSTPLLRKQACEDELKLNRRLASDVYLAVVPVCRTEIGGYNIGGKGRPVEWLVKMRRLQDSHTLDAAIRNETVTPHQLKTLAELLATFYSRQAPAMVRSLEYHRSLMSHIESNRDELLRLAPDLIQQIQFHYSAQMRYANLLAEVFNERVCDGRIVDGHGDLRPEHIYFEGRPTVIDCIEFNAEYRQNDIVDELGFLAMECDALGTGNIGEAILEAYFDASNDRPSRSLISFYKCYRACVRAKVAALRAEQLVGTADAKTVHNVASYLQLASRYAQQLGPKVVITIGGKMGTGKSTLASNLAKQLRAIVFSTDDLRDETQDRSDRLAYGEGKYAPESRNQIYRAMFERFAPAFQSAPTIILDGSFGTQSLRDQAGAITRDAQAELIQVECRCPRKVALQRIGSRRQCGKSSSEARPELYDPQSTDYEPPVETDVIRIDTTQPIVQQESQVLNALRELHDLEARHPAHSHT